MAERNRRLDDLVRELRQALLGRKSGKPAADERQRAFEDLETAVAEGEAAPAEARAAQRNIGRPPADLPRIERVVRPGGTLSPRPCGCGEMARIGEDRTERRAPGLRPFLLFMRPQGASIPAGPVFTPARLRVIATLRPRAPRSGRRPPRA